MPAVIVVLIGASCSVEQQQVSSAEARSPQAEIGGVQETMTTTSSAATPPPVPAEEVDTCVDQTVVRAYVGDEFWGAVWNDHDQDEAQLRGWCEQYGHDDPDGLTALHDNWQRLSQPPATTTTTTVVRRVTIDVTPCTRWVRWHHKTGQPDAVALWEEIEQSESRLLDVCNDLAAGNPGAMREMKNAMDDIDRFLVEASDPPPPRPVPPRPAAARPELAQPPNGCHPNDQGCVPDASDVDCAGGSGNGWGCD